MKEATKFIACGLAILVGVLGNINAIIYKGAYEKQETQISALNETITHLNELQENLIKGEGYTITRQEGTDTVRYIIGSCVKKEVQMFVPVDK